MLDPRDIPIRPVSEAEWPYEVIGRWHLISNGHSSLGSPIARRQWLDEQAKTDKNFEWCFFTSKQYNQETAPIGPYGQISRSLVGHFFYFKRPQDALLFKLTWS